jgi:ATP-binding cassette subfamily C protein CydC
LNRSRGWGGPVGRILRYLRPDWRRLTLAVLSGSAALGSAIGLMATSGWLISRAAQHPPVLYLQVAVVATRTFGISRGVLRYAERLVSHDLALRGVNDLRARIYQRLAVAGDARVTGLRRGDLLSRLGADLDELADLLVRSILPFGVAIVTLIGCTGLVWLLLPAAGVAFVIGFGAAAVGAVTLAWRSARRREQDLSAHRNDLRVNLLRLLDHLPDLQVSGQLADRLEDFGRRQRELERDLDRASQPGALAGVATSLGTGVAVLGSLWLGILAVRTHHLDPVLLAVITLTPLAAVEVVTALPAATTGLLRGRYAAERVLDLIGADLPDPAELPDPAKPDTPPAPTVTGLRLTGLVTGWSADHPLSPPLDLELRTGDRLVITGPSGCGKTTLLLTLAGLIPPLAGRVDLLTGDDTWLPLDTWPAETLARMVSFTADDAHIFGTTLAENLRVARPGAPEPELTGALTEAGLGAWARGLPEGLATRLGSGGTGLSGGQRRRVLLARARLVGASALLLDEPLEHLDGATGERLLADLLAPGPGLVLVVTHQLASLRAEDPVLWFAPDGPTLRQHGELLHLRPDYQSLIR